MRSWSIGVIWIGLLATGHLAAASDLSADEIVRKSVAAGEKSWQNAPNWSYTERDVTSKKNGPKQTKTYQVFLIEGSEYNKLVAVEGHPLSPEENAREEQKLRQEIQRRRHESPGDRAKRVSKYLRERSQDHALMKEMSDGFVFRLLGEQPVRGRAAYVLEATPKPGYTPKSRDARALLGMKGKLYVDKATFQWAKVEAEVIRPVSFYGFLAKVSPGTHFVLEQAPVTESVWLPIHFAQSVKASALGFLNENSTDDETYSNYRPMSAALSALQRPESSFSAGR